MFCITLTTHVGQIEPPPSEIVYWFVCRLFRTKCGTQLLPSVCACWKWMSGPCWEVRARLDGLDMTWQASSLALFSSRTLHIGLSVFPKSLWYGTDHSGVSCLNSLTLEGSRWQRTPCLAFLLLKKIYQLLNVKTKQSWKPEDVLGLQC